MTATLALAFALAPLSVASTGDAVRDTAALQSAFDQASLTGRPVELDASSRPFAVSRTLFLKPAPGRAYAWFDVQAVNKGGYPTLEFMGDGPAVQTVGLKDSKVSNLRIRLHKDGQVGLWASTTPASQSSSHNIFELVTVVAASGTSTAGFWIGPDASGGLLGQDVSNITFSRCSVRGGSKCQDGFHVWGDNTMDLQFAGCVVYDVIGPAFRFETNPPYSKWSRGDGSQLLGCDVAVAGSFLKAAGGSILTVVGGHVERTTGPVLWTTPTGTNPGSAVNGYVSVNGLAFNMHIAQKVRQDGKTPVVFVAGG